MGTTRAEIAGWYDRGVKDGKTFMAVWCDTFDYDDYPVYYDNREETQEAVKKPGSMQRVMEVYDLTRDREAQLNSARAWGLNPPQPQRRTMAININELSLTVKGNLVKTNGTGGDTTLRGTEEQFREIYDDLTEHFKRNPANRVGEVSNGAAPSIDPRSGEVV